MLVTSKEMLQKAKKEKYAVIQPDYIDSQSAKAYITAAEELNVPIILSFAPVCLDVLNMEEAAAIGLFYAKTAKTPVCLHLDHGPSFEMCKQAIELGFTSVMIDASSDTFEENVRKTKEVVDYAHKFGVVVEAELGHVGSNGSAEAVEANDSIYTEVESAKKFVELTNVDSLAVSIGTSHGVYKTGTPVLSFDRLKELSESINVPLVLHGGSSTGEANLNKCAKNGISKINIFTDFLTSAYTDNLDPKPGFYLEQKRMESIAIENVMKKYVKVFETKGE